MLLKGFHNVRSIERSVHAFPRYLCSRQLCNSMQKVDNFQHSSGYSTNVLSTNVNQIHKPVYCGRRAFSTESDDDGRKGRVNDPDRDLGLTNFTFKYSFEFLFLFLTKGTVWREIVVKHFRPVEFLHGIKKAIMYVTEAVANKQFDDLTDVVTPEVLHLLNNNREECIPPMCRPIFPLQLADLGLLSFYGIRLRSGNQAR